MPELLPDTRLSHYRIVSKIGEGGMGEVYLAEDTRLERKVAIKFLSEEFSRDDERLRRFTQEAKAVSALNHPNILTIYEIGEAEDKRFIASEFINGETLREKIAGQALDLHDTLEIVIQIASALEAAHASRIVHRDIKPDNVMLREDSLVKVLDFGLAKLTEQQTSGTEEPTRPHVKTRTGTILGTPSYMSPEQTRGKSVDERSDIWSLGVVLYEMLTKRRPFDGETDGDIIATILRTEPVPPSRHNAAVPAELDRILKKILKKKSDERYQTANDLLIDLKGLKHDLEFAAELERTASTNETAVADSGFTDATISNTPPRISTAPILIDRIGNRKIAVTAGLAVLLLAAIGLGYWYYSSPNINQIDSIAVMPFVNESGNADVEYLSDGMTDSLINSLSNLPNLSVKARNSVFRYKGTEIDEKKIGRDLSVQAVLMGRVTQRGDDIRLHLSLVDSETGTAIWGEQYDRKMSDLSVLQKDITRDVSQKLRLRLSNADAGNLTKNYSENAEAYQLYLKGRYFFNKRTPADFQKSRDYFQKAIDADPTYARAYSGLADYYGVSITFGDLPPNETWPKQEALVRKALELDPDLAEAYNSLAGLKRNYYRDWAGAEQAFKRAFELDPDYAEAHIHYGSHLAVLGRMDEALAERRRALEIEPLSASINMRLAQTLYFMRRYSEAIEKYRTAIDLDPGNVVAHEWLGNVYEQNAMFEQAIEEWSTALTLQKNNELAELLKREFKEAGFKTAVRSVAQKKLDLLNARVRQGDYIPAMRFARLYAQLGARDQTFSWLEKAAVEQNAFIVEILYDPVFDYLRNDPRFPEVIRRMRLPQ